MFFCSLILGIGNYYGAIRRENMDESGLQQELADKILRFHVVANSDSEEDQAVKLMVRDAVGSYMEPLLEGAKDREETVEIVEEHLDEVVQIAGEVLQENGFSYRADASVEMTYFPTKTYGQYTFPEGEYLALKVNLGESRGHNWWCVLYPNMCFRGSVYEVVEEDAKESLREVLSEEEYEAILREGNYEVRLKFLEYFR